MATHLAKHLSVHVKIACVYSKTFEHARSLAEELNSFPVDSFSDIKREVDLNIVCLNDGAIELAAKHLDPNVPVVHTSGSVNMNVFNSFDQHGSLYPLQTFTKNRAVDVDRIPFFIEANSERFEDFLMQFCQNYLSHQVYVLDSDKRLRLHLAAVFANNFSNHLLTMADDILEKTGLNLEVLEPLMLETMQKAFALGPRASQTGPAKRGDIDTIRHHIELLTESDQQQLYSYFSDLIRNDMAR